MVVPLFAVSLLAGLGIAVGFVLFIVPGLFLMTIWAAVAPVVVLERPGVFAAFGRSRELVRGHGWTVLGALALVFLIVLAAGVVAGIVGWRSAGRGRGGRRVGAERAGAAAGGGHGDGDLLRTAPARADGAARHHGGFEPPV